MVPASADYKGSSHLPSPAAFGRRGSGQVALRAPQPAPGRIAPGQMEWRPAGLLAGEGIEASVLEAWRGSEPGGRQ